MTIYTRPLDDDRPYKIEVQADSTGTWAGNAMRYGTFDEAKTAAKDLANRWMLVTAARVVEMDADGATLNDTIVF